MKFFLRLQLLIVVVTAQKWEQKSNEDLLRLLYDSTGGPYWVYPSPTAVPWFQNNVSVCSFWGVVCLPPTDPTVIAALALDHLNLTGSLPEEIGRLNGLERFAVQGNQLEGPIPSSLFTPNISSILLQFNSFSGPIPTQVVGATALTTFYASFNQLSGSLPPFPQTLQVLELRNNALNGTLDHFFGSVGMPALEILSLSMNQLTGSLSPVIFQSQFLQFLELDNNHLTSVPPDSGSFFMSLKIVSFANNNLTGTLPRWMLFSPLISSVDVSHNSLSGDSPLKTTATVFQALGMIAVSTLDFSYNDGFRATTLDDLEMFRQSTDVQVERIVLSGLSSQPASHIPRYYSFSNVAVAESGKSFSCFETQMIRTQAISFQLPPDFWNFTNCQCNRLFWGLPPVCQQCPSDRLQCDADKLVVPVGQYAVFNESTSEFLGMLNCEHCKGSTIHFGQLEFVDTIQCEHEYEGRLCEGCKCEGVDGPCYFPQAGECVECQPTAAWTYGLTGAILALAVTGFMLLKRGSGALLILEGVFVLVLVFFGVGGSYLVDIVLFLILMQLFEVASLGQEESKERAVPYSLAGVAKILIFFVQASVLLVRNVPGSLGAVVNSISAFNFHSSSIECTSLFRTIAVTHGHSFTRFLFSLTIPVVLMLFMAFTIALRRIVQWLRQCKCRKRKRTQELEKKALLYEKVPPPPSHLESSTADPETMPLITDEPLTENTEHVPVVVDHHDGGAHHEEHEEEVTLAQEVAGSLLFVLFATYFELSDKILENLSCVADPFTGLRYMEAEPGNLCSGAEYETLAIMSWCLVVIFVFGVPLLFFAGVWYNRARLHNHEVEHVWGVFYENYQSRFWFWELVWMLRRIGIAFALGFLGESMWSNFVIGFVLVASAGLALELRPFKHDFENRLELINTGVILFTWSTSLSEIPESSALWTLMAVNALWLLVLMGFLVHGSGIIPRVIQWIKRKRGSNNKKCC